MVELTINGVTNRTDADADTPVTWDPGEGKDLSTQSIRSAYQQGLDANDVAIGRRVGDVDALLKAATTIVRADYEVPFLAHTTMEPQTCTAHVNNGRAEIWAPTQNGEGTLRNVAKAISLCIKGKGDPYG